MLRILCILAAACFAAAGQTVSHPKTPAGSGPVQSPTPASESQVRKPVALPSYKDLKFAPLPPPKIPDIHTFTMPNGLRVYLLETHDLPLVSGLALVRTGNLFDPADKRGLAEITGEVLRAGGTKAKTGDQIDVELEDVAASVESQIGETNGSVSFSTLRENTGEVLRVFHDLLTAPEFRDDKLELAKTQLRSAIARRNDDPNGILAREFSSIVYGRNTPYGWDMEYADVNNIHRDDLLTFYKRYYFPANVMLAVYGDFNTAEMQAKLEHLFSDWNTKELPVPRFPAVEKTPVPGVFVATKTDVTQTFFEVGHLGGTLRDKDYPALEVAAEILGGGFSSRLFQRIRTQLGYAYNIGAGWNANYDHPGTFRISGSTQSSHTVDTLRAVREELDRLRSAPVSDQELKTAKDTVLNSFVFFFDRPSKTLNRLLTYEYYGYPKDFIFQYQKNLEAVTKADVLRVAKEYFRPEDLTIVAVGNPADFKTPITELGLKVQPIDLTIPEPKKTVPAGPSDAASGQRGLELLRRMQHALGGDAKLVAIRDMDSLVSVALSMNGHSASMKQHNIVIRPGTMRQDIEGQFGKQTVYVSDDSGWMATPQGDGSAPGAVVEEVKGQLFREMYTLALSDQFPNRTITSPDPNVLEIADAAGHQVQFKLDPKTGLPDQMEYETKSAGGAPVKRAENYSTWRSVDGIQVPFEITVAQDGQRIGAATILNYKFNTGVTPAQLGKK